MDEEPLRQLPRLGDREWIRWGRARGHKGPETHWLLQRKSISAGSGLHILTDFIPT